MLPVTNKTPCNNRLKKEHVKNHYSVRDMKQFIAFYNTLLCLSYGNIIPYIV